MCKKRNRRSRRVSNYRTRVWVNQYNNIENNYGTVSIVAKEVDEREGEEQYFALASNDNVPDIAIQVVNVQQEEQYSTHGQESDQGSGEVTMTLNTPVIHNLFIGVVFGVVCKGIYSFFKHNK